MVLTLVVQVSLGSAEGIGTFRFGVRLLRAEEIGLLLDPTEPAERALPAKTLPTPAPSALL